MKTDYLMVNYHPKKDREIIATFYVESKLPLKAAASEIAAESSIGTWTKVTTLTPEIFKKLSAKVFYLNPRQKIVKIAYPLALFELGNLPQLLSSIGGNIFSMKIIKNLRLLDLEFPDKYINSYQGPKYGIKGIRNILGIEQRPIIGAIMKPKVGLNPKQYATLAESLWRGGVDVIKDDENLTDLSFNHFKDRVKQILKTQKKLAKELNQKKIYIFNVSAPFVEMLARANLVKKAGGRCVMIDIVSTGLDNVQSLRQKDLGLILHGHRAGHSLFTRNPKHGLTMLVLAKLARLAGVDQLHTGTVVGKMEGSANEVIAINKFLKSPFGKLKPVLPIASGGLHPGLVSKLIKILGKDLIINFGGGLHGHPDGSAEGAAACFAAVEATMKNIQLNKYSNNHLALKKALEHWK